MDKLSDVQNTKPEIPKDIDKVGVRELILPYKVLTREGSVLHTVANVSAYVTLTSNFRGINMSRIPQVLHKHIDKSISSDYVEEVLVDLCKTLKAPSSYLKVKFPYFLKKAAPVTKTEGYMYYPCVFEGELKEDQIKHLLTVEVPYASVCECSKQISDRGAHNQRSIAKVTVVYRKERIVWIEDLIEVVEKHASAPLFSILKRPDEKWVTEHGYDNPKFVETMARDIYKDLMKDDRILGFVVVVNHYESIHQHNAVAVIHGGYVYVP